MEGDVVGFSCLHSQSWFLLICLNINIHTADVSTDICNKQISIAGNLLPTKNTAKGEVMAGDASFLFPLNITCRIVQFFRFCCLSPRSALCATICHLPLRAQLVKRRKDKPGQQADTALSK